MEKQEHTRAPLPASHMDGYRHKEQLLMLCCGMGGVWGTSPSPCKANALIRVNLSSPIIIISKP